MKKEKSPVLVVLTMFLLSLFIILPPVFRKTIPKQTESSEEMPQLVIIKCNKIYEKDLYQVSSRTKFTNGKIVNNIITFEKLDSLPEYYQSNDTNNTTTDTNVQTTSLTDEISYFKSIPNLNLVSNDKTITVTIDSTTMEQNPSEEKLKQCFNNSITLQKKYYQGLGFTCTVMKS